MPDNVILVLDILAILAAAVLAYLVFLLLFERGASYGTSEPLHHLDDAGRMGLLTALLATPYQPVRSWQVLREGPSLYEAEIAAIRAASRSVHLEAYIFYPGRAADAFLETLCERARAGVNVRVIVDAIGSLRTRRKHFAALEAAGGRVYRYHALAWQTFLRWNSRTHRNLLIVDGRTAFIGGAGIADHWIRTTPPPWRDCAVRVTGPIVRGLQAVFAENWLECSGELLVGSDTFADHPPAPGDDSAPSAIAVGSTPTAGRSTRARILVQSALAMASETIELCSPYFIPDLGIRRELLAARQRGVHVRVLTGGPYSDHGIVRRAGRRRYGELLQAGIEIWEFSSHMMHSKILVVDGRWSLVGSTNIDHRSFGLNDEVNLLVLDRPMAGELLTTFEEDLRHSEQLNLQSWRRRPFSERLLATLGRLIERHQ
jgi:cardiolipin synthase A/B